MNLQTINDVLHTHGMRVTPQRIWIYNYLVENKTHPDAESLYCMLLNDGCNATRATVYNVLQRFLKCGLISEVKTDVARTRYDARVETHGHFMCNRCHAITDFDIDNLSVSGLDGFETQQKEIYFSGVCDKCKNNSKQGEQDNEKICM